MRKGKSKLVGIKVVDSDGFELYFDGPDPKDVFDRFISAFECIYELKNGDNKKEEKE